MVGISPLRGIMSVTHKRGYSYYWSTMEISTMCITMYTVGTGDRAFLGISARYHRPVHVAADNFYIVTNDDNKSVPHTLGGEMTAANGETLYIRQSCPGRRANDVQDDKSTCDELVYSWSCSAESSALVVSDTAVASSSDTRINAGFLR